MDTISILLIATNTGRYDGHNLPTGLWLSELTHIYDSAKKEGYDIVIASPEGGAIPVDPESLKPAVLDKISYDYWNDSAFREMLGHTKSLDEVSGKRFDCVYLAGGHGTMYDFPDNKTLQAIVREQYESGKVVAAICHGVCGLLHVRLSDGRHLIRNKRLTGFSWFEESLARRKKVVPFNLEAALKERGSVYKKAFIPMTSKVVTDGNLITGQNPFSSEETARTIVKTLKSNRI